MPCLVPSYSVSSFLFSLDNNTANTTRTITSDKITKSVKKILNRLTKKPRVSKLETAEYCVTVMASDEEEEPQSVVAPGGY